MLKDNDLQIAKRIQLTGIHLDRGGEAGEFLGSRFPSCRGLLLIRGCAPTSYRTPQDSMFLRRAGGRRAPTTPTRFSFALDSTGWA